MLSNKSISTQEHQNTNGKHGQSNCHDCTISAPHENDVLLGRGGKNREHIGNQNLKAVAHRCRNLYAKASRKDKPLIASEIVKKISSLEPSGRFLKQDPISLQWQEVPHEVAQEKVSQCLRDIVSSRRRHKPKGCPGADHNQASQSLRIEYLLPSLSSAVSLATPTDAGFNFNRDFRYPTFVAFEPFQHAHMPMMSRFLPVIGNPIEIEIEKTPIPYKTGQDERSVIQLDYGTHRSPTDFIRNIDPKVTRPYVGAEIDVQQQQRSHENRLTLHRDWKLDGSVSRIASDEGQNDCTREKMEQTLRPCPGRVFFEQGELEDISIDCIFDSDEVEDIDYSTVFENNDLKESH